MLQKTLIMSFMLICGSLHFLSGQSTHKLLRNGDRLYGLGKWNDAEIEYRKAKQNQSDLTSNYNLGNTLMHQDRASEAIETYKNAAESKGTDAQKADAYYNLGNAYFNEKKYNESIEAYKNALKLQPKDLQSKENLAIAKKQLKIQQQQQQKQQQSQDQKDQQQQNKDTSENGSNQESQDKSNQQKDQDQLQNNENNGAQQPQKQEMSKEKAEKLLQIMDSEEKKVQEKLRRGNPAQKSRKNW